MPIPIRPALVEDAASIAEAYVDACCWRPGQRRQTLAEIEAEDKRNARYFMQWGHVTGDTGVIAKSDDIVSRDRRTGSWRLRYRRPTDR